MYLRLSVTAACELRCLYCRPHGSVCSTVAELNTAELLGLVSALHRHTPIHKIRLTGGEPLLRSDLPLLLRHLRAGMPAAELCLTSNGVRLAPLAETLRRAGLDRLNVSLDSVEAETFARITGHRDLEAVLDGLAAARAVGFAPLKVNVVLMRRQNGAQLVGLVRFLAPRVDELRFIELMPLGVAGALHSEEYLPAATALARLHDEWPAPQPLGRDGTADRYLFSIDGRPLIVGLITTVSQPFCNGCDRVRLDARGRLFACLRETEGADLASPLRRGNDAEFVARIGTELADKPQLATRWPQRAMIAMGG